MKTASKKKLKNIEIDVDETGFVIWVTENINGRNERYWIVDGSLVKESGEIGVYNDPKNKMGSIVVDWGIKIVANKKSKK